MITIFGGFAENRLKVIEVRPSILRSKYNLSIWSIRAESTALIPYISLLCFPCGDIRLGPVVFLPVRKRDRSGGTDNN